MVIASNMLVFFLPTYVLFDIGSSHTFKSTQFARKMNKEHEPLGYELVVSRSTNKCIICSMVYQDNDVALRIRLYLQI